MLKVRIARELIKLAKELSAVEISDKEKVVFVKKLDEISKNYGKGGNSKKMEEIGVSFKRDNDLRNLYDSSPEKTRDLIDDLVNYVGNLSAKDKLDPVGMGKKVKFYIDSIKKELNK